MNFAIVIKYLYPDIQIGPGEPGDQCVLSETGIVFWDYPAPQPTLAELEAAEKPAYAARKTEEIYREQEIRSKTVWGKEVDRFFFAWVEELYGKILKVSARNNITAVDTPITFGLKALRDNRVTLLAGLQTWVDDPLKTAEDIAAFDVANWAGWSVARP
jgi:hypothetical protein